MDRNMYQETFNKFRPDGDIKAVRTWLVKGDDPNPDWGGSHVEPILGVVRGTFDQAVKWAIRRRDFYIWGPGSIKELHVADLSTVPILADDAERLLREHIKAGGYLSLMRSGVPLDGLKSMFESNIKAFDRVLSAEDVKSIMRYVSGATTPTEFVACLNSI